MTDVKRRLTRAASDRANTTLQHKQKLHKYLDTHKYRDRVGGREGERGREEGRRNRESYICDDQHAPHSHINKSNNFSIWTRIRINLKHPTVC